MSPFGGEAKTPGAEYLFESRFVSFLFRHLFGIIYPKILRRILPCEIRASLEVLILQKKHAIKRLAATGALASAAAVMCAVPVHAAPSPTAATTTVQMSKAEAAAAILATDEVCIGYDYHNVTEDWEIAKLSTVVETFQKVPTSVQKFLGKKHVGIVMEDPGAVSMKAFMNGESEDTSNKVLGLWLPEAHGISVGYNTADVTVCHEVGHALDTYTGLSSTDTWNTIYATEAVNLQSSGAANYMTSAKEYFGEAFNQYCLNKKTLKATCPNTYAYIDAAVAAIA